MSVELFARVSCSRCPTVIEMENIDTIVEAYQRAHEADWCEEEQDGEMVCPECWVKWDASHPAAGAVDPSASSTGNPTTRD